MKKLTAIVLIGIFVVNLSQAQTTWKVLSPTKTVNTYVATSFINDKEGWLIDDHGYLWHTTDGAVTLDAIAGGEYFSKLDFTNEQIGYGLGVSTVYKTTDGGYSWNSLALPGGVG